MKTTLTNLLLTCSLLVFVAASCPSNKTAYQTIGATEAAIYTANGIYLNGVVSGLFSTNGVPAVEAAFNDMQLTLHVAAAIAAAGTNSPVTAPVLAKANAFTNTINNASHK